jgi:cation:H+ antiporter
MVTFDPLLVNTAFFLVALAIVFKSADYIVYGITKYSKRVGISDLLSGLVVVAMAASMPEVIVGIMGLIRGTEGVMFGAILGTNMVHMALVIGVLAIVGKKVNLESEILGKGVWGLWLVLLIPLFLIVWDQQLGRIDGAILVALYLGFLVWLWKKETKIGHLKKRVKFKKLLEPGAVFLLALVAILLSGIVLVDRAVAIAEILQWSTFFIAATVLSICGALPDFAVGLRSILKGHQDVGVGDILGSVSLQFLLFFGIVGLINPLTVSARFATFFTPNNILNAIIFLVVSLTLLIYFVNKKEITWKQGIIFLVLYLGFLSLEITKLVKNF